MPSASQGLPQSSSKAEVSDVLSPPLSLWESCTHRSKITCLDSTSFTCCWWFLLLVPEGCVFVPLCGWPQICFSYMQWNMNEIHVQCSCQEEFRPILSNHRLFPKTQILFSKILNKKFYHFKQRKRESAYFKSLFCLRVCLISWVHTPFRDSRWCAR